MNRTPARISVQIDRHRFVLTAGGHGVFVAGMVLLAILAGILATLR